MFSIEKLSIGGAPNVLLPYRLAELDLAQFDAVVIDTLVTIPGALEAIAVGQRGLDKLSTIPDAIPRNLGHRPLLFFCQLGT